MAGSPRARRSRGAATAPGRGRVIVDDLASQVLVFNLPATGGPLGEWMSSAAASGLPFGVTLHQLLASPVTVTAPVVYVCENPAVLRTAAERLGAASAPLVCTEGVASVACRRLVAAARSGGAALRWRNDFDWPGLRMTGAAIADFGASPWRMSADDYSAVVADVTVTEPLTGSPATSTWDPALAEAMVATGRAVMEERLVDAATSRPGRWAPGVVTVRGPRVPGPGARDERSSRAERGAERP